ncbi:endonuclease III [Candidatus Woesearchaeota archaeon]|nr:endonuclease III [Candidatus Woesearchaeota archaeon]
MTLTQYAKSFDYNSFMTVLEKAAKGYNVPVITLIAVQEKDPFKVLISTMLSARTKDEVTSEASKKLYAKADTAEKLAAMPVDEIERLIYPVGFYKTKAPRLKETAQILLDKYNGKVPDEMDELLGLPGVGRKTANLVLGEAFRKDAICVDTHVHRISNRLGLLETKTPHDTEMNLRKILPRKYWITYNTYLVAHGQSVCKPISPICSKCSIKGYCRRVGVDRSR